MLGSSSSSSSKTRHHADPEQSGARYSIMKVLKEYGAKVGPRTIYRAAFQQGSPDDTPRLIQMLQSMKVDIDAFSGDSFEGQGQGQGRSGSGSGSSIGGGAATFDDFDTSTQDISGMTALCITVLSHNDLAARVRAARRSGGRSRGARGWARPPPSHPPSSD